MPKLPRTVNLPVPASPTRREILEGLRITAPVAALIHPSPKAFARCLDVYARAASVRPATVTAAIRSARLRAPAVTASTA